MIRPAKKSEMSIIENLFSILFPKAVFKNLEKDIFLLAENNNGRPVGFCHFRIRKKTCYIAGLGVLPSYRHHGIGSLLMAYALNMIDKHNVQTTVLKVKALNHASSLYLNFGFFEKRVGETLTLIRKRPS